MAWVILFSALSASFCLAVNFVYYILACLFNYATNLFAYSNLSSPDFNLYAF